MRDDGHALRAKSILQDQQLNPTVVLDYTPELLARLRDVTSPYHVTVSTTVSQHQVRMLFGYLYELHMKKQFTTQVLRMLQTYPNCSAFALLTPIHGMIIHEWNRCVYHVAYDNNSGISSLLPPYYLQYRLSTHAQSPFRAAYVTFDEVCCLLQMVHEHIVYSQFTTPPQQLPPPPPQPTSTQGTTCPSSFIPSYITSTSRMTSAVSNGSDTTSLANSQKAT